MLLRAVRCLGDITPEKLDILRHADEIVLEEIIAEDLYRIATVREDEIRLPPRNGAAGTWAAQ